MRTWFTISESVWLNSFETKILQIAEVWKMAPGAVSYRPCRVRRGVRLSWRRGNAGGCPFDACDQGRHERRVLATGGPVAVEKQQAFDQQSWLSRYDSH